MKHYVIGAGGVGSWLVPKLIRLEKNLILIDGDTLEEKNLDRQLFDRDQIGRNKAKALAERYGAWFVPEYFSAGLPFDDGPPTSDDLLWCCADNHAARRETLDACDLYGCRAIIAANEYVDAESYFYEQEMAHTPNDPRVFYPDILTDRSGDPLGPPGCVEAARKSPQLVIANSAASEFAMWLFWFHFRERPQMEAETKPYWPVHHRGSSLQMRTIKWGDRLSA